MRKILLFVLLFLPLSLMAQQNDSISLNKLVERYRSQGMQVYSLAPDSIKVPLFLPYNAENLERTVNPTIYKLSRFNDQWFILPFNSLLTEMPALRVRKNKDDSGYVPFVIASSENQVYEFGTVTPQIPERKFKLTGTVVNFATGMPQIGVQVHFKEQNLTALTGGEGQFAFDLPAGYHTIEIKGMDIVDTERKFQLFSDGITRIELEEDNHMLDELVVVSGRTENVHTTQVGLEKFRPALLKNVPLALGEADIMKMIQTLPGVKSVGEASSGYNVRGGATDQNLILFNHGTVYNPSHLFGLFSAFNSDMVNDVELYKSSIPGKYGGRISSVLNIVPKEADKKKFTGSANLGLLTSKAHLEIPVLKDKLSIMLDGRTTYSDWILKKLPEDSGYKNGTAGFFDVGSVISYNLNKRNKINLYGYYSHDRFAFTEYSKYEYTNTNASAEWRTVFNDKLNSSIVAGWDHYDYGNDETEVESMASRLSFSINQVFFKGDFSWQMKENHLLKLGWNSILYNVQPGKYVPLGESNIAYKELQTEKALESAVYLEDEWNVTDKLALNLGLRYSIFNAIGPRTYNTYSPDMLPSAGSVIGTEQVDGGIFKTYHAPEIRLSGRYSIDDWSSLKVGFNTMHQYIHKVSNSIIMSPTDIWKLSDANIAPQSGWQLAGGYYYQTHNRMWEVSAEIYYKHMNDYLTYRSGATLLMNEVLEQDVISTQGKAFGVELQLKKPAGKLNGWVSYAYSRTFLRQHDDRVARPINDGDWFPTEYDRPHEFKLVGNYKFTERYSMSCNVDYSTGRPTTIPTAFYKDYASNQVRPFYSDRNGYRIPDYLRMDLSFNIEASHHLTLLTHSSISFGVYNVLGRKNAYSIYFEDWGTKPQGYKLSIFGAPIPFVTYNIKF